MVKALLHHLIDHARAEIRQTAGTTIAEAIEKIVAPVTLAVRVVMMTTPGNVGIHGTLSHRLRLLDRRASLVTLRRRGFFAVSTLKS
jgi:class 3 adenylate cyclase